MPHPSVLDEREPFSKPLMGSLALHTVVVAIVLVSRPDARP